MYCNYYIYPLVLKNALFKGSVELYISSLYIDRMLFKSYDFI